MAKEINNVGCSMEVAPPLLISTTKIPPISPVLETITEEDVEEHPEKDS